MPKNTLSELINSFPVADTHEHLIEERARLDPANQQFPDDIGLLFIQYMDSDLISAGMPQLQGGKLASREVNPEDKWAIIRNWWPFIQLTGSGQVVIETVRTLYGISEISDVTWKALNDKIHSLPRPGFYSKILREVCKIDHCQINALDQKFFRKTDMPDLFFMDLCISTLCSDFDPDAAEEVTGTPVRCLDDCLTAIDSVFERYGPVAVAVKNQSAYRRRMNYAAATPEEAERSLQYLLKNRGDAEKRQLKCLEDYLFHYTVEKSVAFDLPYKLHTGYHSGTGTMSLHDVRRNPADMADICRLHPDARFVFMHITFPYQNELIALARHYPNAWVDMCWSWMIDPLAAVNFLKEFLVSVPVNKLFVFGGDVSIVELVPGQLALMKRGLDQALSSLLKNHWLTHRDLELVIERLMYKNALEFFPIRKLREPAPGTETDDLSSVDPAFPPDPDRKQG